MIILGLRERAWSDVRPCSWTDDSFIKPARSSQVAHLVLLDDAAPGCYTPPDVARICLIFQAFVTERRLAEYPPAPANYGALVFAIAYRQLCWRCRSRPSAVEAANNALDRLERDDPARYDKLLRDRRSNK